MRSTVFVHFCVYNMVAREGVCICGLVPYHRTCFELHTAKTQTICLFSCRLTVSLYNEINSAAFNV